MPKDIFLNHIELELFYSTQEWQGIQPYSHLLNSAAVLLGYADQFNYYLKSGFKLALTKNLGKNFTSSLSFISEKQSSMNEDKYISIFNRSRFVRQNPGVNEGFDRKFQLSFLAGESPFDFTVIPENGLLINADISNKFLKSDFNYYKIFFAGQVKTKTFYRELFVSPFLLFNVEGGYIKNNFGIQQMFSPIASIGFYSPITAFKGLRPYQFAGDKMIALHIEHNWRTIIFQALGLDFLTNLELDIIMGASSVRIWNDTKYLNKLTQRKPYGETFIGISRILGIVRADFSYNSFKIFNATLSTAVVF